MVDRTIWSSIFLLYLLIFQVCDSKINEFDDKSKSNEVIQKIDDDMKKIIKEDPFIISFRVFQNLMTSGTLLEIETDSEIVLKLETDATTAQIRLTYRSISNGHRASMSSSVQLSDGNWHEIVLFCSDGAISLFLDCRKILRNFGSDFDQEFLKSASDDDRQLIKIGASNIDSNEEIEHLEFPGIIEDLLLEKTDSEPKCRQKAKQPKTLAVLDASKMDKYEPVTLWNQQAHTIEIQNDFAPSTKKTVHKDVDYLRQRVHHVESELNKWRNTVESMQHRLKHVQLHQRGCMHQDKYLSDGDKVSNNESCTECMCSRGKLHCKVMGCPLLDCDQVIKVKGQCCPKCAKQCIYRGKKYSHSEEYWPKKCVKCLCHDGNMKCAYHRERDDKCPKLDCPKAEQKTLTNRCCPICTQVDFCRNASCHSNSTCSVENHEAVCKCKEGFFGDGKHCFDIDECQWNADARIQLGGCGLGTRCVNLAGSFKCECLPGYARVNEKTCFDAIFP